MLFVCACVSSARVIHVSSASVTAGYGFVDYDSVQAAETAIKALQAAGIQAQMAKVRRRR